MPKTVIKRGRCGQPKRGHTCKLAAGGVAAHVRTSLKRRVVQPAHWDRREQAKRASRAWTTKEDVILRQAQSRLGNKWVQIAKLLPGRGLWAAKKRWYNTLRRPNRVGSASSENACERTDSKLAALPAGGCSSRGPGGAVSHKRMEPELEALRLGELKCNLDCKAAELECKVRVIACKEEQLLLKEKTVQAQNKLLREKNEELRKMAGEVQQLNEALEYEYQEKGFQIRATNSLQTKVDELASLALAAGADAETIRAIKLRPL